jgi:iron(III) transport system ATP-binding protein
MVEDKAFRGANILYTLRLASGRKVYSSWPSRLDFAPGAGVGVSIRVNHIVLFPAGG